MVRSVLRPMYGACVIRRACGEVPRGDLRRRVELPRRAEQQAARHPIARKYSPTIRTSRPTLVHRPSYSASTDLTIDDYQREGFIWLTENGERERVAKIMRSWSARPINLFVVEFELVDRVA